MNYLNLAMQFLNRRPFAGADTLDVGIWVRLLKHCGESENGGRITGARLWKSSEWIRVAGITEEEFHREAPGLWKTDGDDVIVFGYPIDQEEKVKANRQNGKLGGRPRDVQRTAGNHMVNHKPTHTAEEKKRKEKKFTTTRDEFGIHPSDLDEYGPAPNSTHPDPDPLWTDFLEHREPFERFDDFRNRFAPNGPPTSN